MKKLFPMFLVLLFTALCLAQDASAPPEPMNETPVFRVQVVARTTKAVNYRHRGGSTTVDLKGTSLMPEASGRAKVNGKEGRLEIDAEIAHMAPATKFGGQFLTYVLWAITPEGRSVNLGEVVLNDDGKCSIDVTTDLQAFGLVITAEPYFAVTRPSDKIVVENIIRQETKGFEQPIDARFDMLEGGQYTIDVPADRLPSASAAPKTPLNLLEARNAVAIAKAAGAHEYASDSLSKAEEFLARAEDYLQRKQGRTPIGTAARGATQMAEDSRVLTLKKKEAERIAAEKRAMQDAQEKAEAEAKASAEAEARAKAQSEEDAMPDVLFDSGQYTLKPAARERLARISGIVLAYPDLKLEIEGHTDSIGTDDYNQRLSEKRATTVRDYLVDANVPGDNVVSRGFGKIRPVADNKTAAGRKLNRRVEMIVSGDVIGDIVATPPESAPPPPAEPPK